MKCQWEHNLTGSIEFPGGKLSFNERNYSTLDLAFSSQFYGICKAHDQIYIILLGTAKKKQQKRRGYHDIFCELS